MIHLKNVIQAMKAKDAKGRPIPFSIKYVSASTGRIVEMTDAVLSKNVKDMDKEVKASANLLPKPFKSQGSLDLKMNIMQGDEVRGASTIFIIEFNGQEVCY